jgi:hypothetical protein
MFLYRQCRVSVDQLEKHKEERDGRVIQHLLYSSGRRLFQTTNQTACTWYLNCWFCYIYSWQSYLRKNAFAFFAWVRGRPAPFSSTPPNSLDPVDTEKTLEDSTYARWLSAEICWHSFGGGRIYQARRTAGSAHMGMSLAWIDWKQIKAP